MKKRKYYIFTNSKYAILGFIYTFKNEMSFKLDILFGSISIILAFGLKLNSYEIVFILITVFIILITELLNTGIEKVVDLVTEDYEELAKYAKDIGASAVMFAVILHILTWIIIIFNYI